MNLTHDQARQVVSAVAAVLRTQPQMRHPYYDAEAAARQLETAGAMLADYNELYIVSARVEGGRFVSAVAHARDGSPAPNFAARLRGVLEGVRPLAGSPPPAASGAMLYGFSFEHAPGAWATARGIFSWEQARAQALECGDKAVRILAGGAVAYEGPGCDAPEAEPAPAASG